MCACPVLVCMSECYALTFGYDGGCVMGVGALWRRFGAERLERIACERHQQLVRPRGAGLHTYDVPAGRPFGSGGGSRAGE